MKYKIILVEDDFSFGSCLKELLELHGIETKWFRNAKDAFDWITKINHVDLILSDVKMPMMNGSEFLIELRKSTELQKIPIVFITALPSDSFELKGFHGNTIIQKPFSFPQLMEVMQPHLSDVYQETQKELKELFQQTVQEMINQNDLESILSFRLRMDVEKLNKWAVQTFQLTLQDYIEKVKVKKMLLLMATKKTTKYEVMESCGINNEAEIQEIFFKHMGYYPSIY